MTYPPDGGLETPAEDAAEQAAGVLPDGTEDEPDDRTLDDETPEWDAREQGRVVELDDEYR